MLYSASNMACMRLKVGDSARIRRYPECFTLKNMSLDTLALNLAVAAQIQERTVEWLPHLITF